jgi:hypothetical protein
MIDGQSRAQRSERFFRAKSRSARGNGGAGIARPIVDEPGSPRPDARATAQRRPSTFGPVLAVRPRVGLSRLPPHDGNRGNRFHLTIVATDEFPPALMHQPVVPMAEENKVVEIR